VPGTTSGLLADQPEDLWVYFVHSFAPEVGPETVATCDYGGTVPAVVERGNVWATQFHPEKSGAVGLSLLANFVTRCKEAVGPGRCWPEPVPARS
jgi:imidazole glycerol-phosphate synthase subunit HisH